MLSDASQTLSPRLAPSPRHKVLYLVGPLTLLAVWFAGLRPATDFSGTASGLGLGLLCGGIVCAWAGRAIWTRIAAAICILTAAVLLILQIGGATSGLNTAATADAIALGIVAIATLMVVNRSTSPVFAALVVFVLVQIIQYSSTSLLAVAGGIPELGHLLQSSPFSAAIHFLIGMALLMQLMLRPTATMEQARTWPQAATASVLYSVISTIFIVRSGFATVAIAVSGAALIAIVFLGCSAAVTRLEMFRLHLRLRRKARNQSKQQDALVSARSDYEELYEQVPIGVMKTVDTGRIISANSRMCEIMGYDNVEQMAATDLRALFVDPERRKRDFLAWKNSGDREWTGDVEMLKRDGTPIIARFTGSRVNDSRGNLRHVLTCYEDVTEQRSAAREIKKLESDLRLTHKLEAVGRLAAGVAHEINTPMQYIGDNVFFLSSAYEDLRALTRALTEQLRKVAADAGMSIDDAIAALEEEADLEYLDESVSGSFERTLDGVKSVADIVRSMKEFAYPNDKTRSLIDINGLLSNTLTVSRSMYVAVANVVTDFGEVPPTMCFPGELNQVFVNLVVNAAHAVEKANQTRGRPMGEIGIKTRLNGKMIEIEISDNGSGMPDAVRKRIFDPFFTTKEVGKGTGQGLAIAHSIIADKHDGTIDVRSESGKGTTFTVAIPLCESESGA
jgi:PAS domain S-box-containing protein